MEFKPGQLLSQIEFPNDLREKLKNSDLPQLKN